MSRHILTHSTISDMRRGGTMKGTFLLTAVSALLAIMGCGEHSSLVPKEGTKIAVVEFTVAPNARIERYNGNGAPLGMVIAKAVAEDLHENGDHLDDVAIPISVPPQGDLIVRGEIAHVYGGNVAVQMTVLICTVCGWWTGNPMIGAQGTVERPDGTIVARFSDETRRGSTILGRWHPGVELTAARMGETIGDMVKDGAYKGGHVGNDGYLAPAAIPAVTPVVNAPQAAGSPPHATDEAATRLRALDALRSQGLISADEYATKRQRILDE